MFKHGQLFDSGLRSVPIYYYELLLYTKNFQIWKKFSPNLSSIQITHIFKITMQERADIYS